MDNNFDRIFNYVVIPTMVTAIVLFFAITRIVNHRTNEALKDYSMLPDDIEVVDNIILGRSYPGFRYLFSKHFNYGFGKLFRSGAIELICTDNKDILLLVRGFMHKYASTGRSARGFFHIAFRVEDGIQKGDINLLQQVTFVHKGYFDTIISEPLSKVEIDFILEAIDEKKSFNTISFATQDGVVDFIDIPNILKAEIFVNRCHRLSTQ